MDPTEDYPARDGCCYAFWAVVIIAFIITLINVL